MSRYLDLKTGLVGGGSEGETSVTTEFASSCRRRLASPLPLRECDGAAPASTMCMLPSFEFNGHSNEPSMTYAALGNDMPSEVPDILHRAPQHRYFHATIVIKVNVHRRNRQIMVLVRGPGQALRQFAVVMIVDVDECCHACLCDHRKRLGRNPRMCRKSADFSAPNAAGPRRNLPKKGGLR